MGPSCGKEVHLWEEGIPPHQHGISWVRDGDSEPEAASACGDVQSKASVDVDMAFKQKHAIGPRPHPSLTVSPAPNVCSSGLRF